MANEKCPADYRAHAVELPDLQEVLELGLSNELLRRWVHQDDLDKDRRSNGPTTTERVHSAAPAA